jgi:hypothetical protein
MDYYEIVKNIIGLVLLAYKSRLVEDTSWVQVELQHHHSTSVTLLVLYMISAV